MGARSQRKGRTAEIELSRILQGYGIHAEPGQAASYGSTPDITGVPGIHCEVKRCQQLRIPDWMEQAAGDAKKFKDGVPAVFFRRNREPWFVVMALEDWMAIYKQEREGDNVLSEKREKETFH